MAREFRIDRSELRPPQRRADGSVRYDAALSRVGVFSYRLPNGTTRREYRPPDEVGHKDSIASAELAHIVDEHPTKRGDAKGKNVGQVGDALRFDGLRVEGSCVVRDDVVNAKIAAGKSHLSPGYDVDLDETPGVSPDGERYDAVQRCIRYEHFAIVAEGRQGDGVALRTDAADAMRLDAAIQITDEERNDAAASGPPTETVMEELKKALAEVAAQTLRADAAERNLTEERKAHASAITAEKARADKAEARADAEKDRADAADKARKDATDAAPDIARARFKLEAEATAVLGAEFKLDALDDTGIKRAVVEKLIGRPVEKDRTADYVSARYDAAVEAHAKADAATGAARGLTAGSRTSQDAAQKARADHAERARTAGSKPLTGGN